MIKVPFRRTTDKTQQGLGLRQMEDAIVGLLEKVQPALTQKLDGNNRVTFDSVAPGFVVGHEIVRSGAVRSTTIQIPFDDTIPQVSEGAEFLSVLYTPKKIGNIILVRTSALVSSSVGNRFAVSSICKNGLADSKAAAAMSLIAGGDIGQIAVDYSEVIPSLRQTKWSLRAGLGAVGTLTFNGVGGARRFGGVASSLIEVVEISRDIL